MGLYIYITMIGWKNHKYLWDANNKKALLSGCVVTSGTVGACFLCIVESVFPSNLAVDDVVHVRKSRCSGLMSSRQYIASGDVPYSRRDDTGSVQNVEFAAEA